MEDRVKIEHHKFRQYLKLNGWKELPSNRKSLDVFVEPKEDNPFEIFLPNNNYGNDYDLILRNALKAVSYVEDRDETLVALNINRIDKDLFNYRVSVDSQDSISVNLLTSLLESATYTLKEAATFEENRIYNNLTRKERESIRRRDEVDQFMEGCAFAHTWRGSFGVTIETPLQIVTTPLCDDIPDTLGRKTTKRILWGHKLISDGVEKGSADYIVEKLEAIEDVLMFERLPELRDSLGKNTINLDVKMSPIIPARTMIKGITKVRIDGTSLQILEKAIEQVKEPSSIKDVEIVGWPKTMSTSKEDLLKDVEEAERKVTVKGVCHEINATSLKMDLTLEDYRKAIQAQMQVKTVRVRCDVRKKHFGWEVTHVRSFELLD